jgi:hypothetical protein
LERDAAIHGPEGNLDAITGETGKLLGFVTMKGRPV